MYILAWDTIRHQKNPFGQGFLYGSHDLYRMARLYHYELDDEEIIPILLRQLPPDIQQIIRLIYYEYIGLLELSRKFNISEETMRSCHRRILSWLRIWFCKFKTDREKLVWGLRMQQSYERRYYNDEAPSDI